MAMAEYDRLAQVYIERRKDKTRFDYNRDIEAPALIKMIGNAKDKTILDIGCGFGYHVKLLSKQKFKRVSGFDISEELVRYAQLQRIPNTEFYVGDMNKRFRCEDSSFDIAFASLAIHYAKNLDRLFREVKRVLKKNGIFCFSTGHPIFNMINQTDEHMIACRKDSDGKRNIVGNYFDESEKEYDLGQALGKVRMRNLTYETLLKTALKNGFELIDYVDARPIPASRKLDEEKYRLTTTLPTFILFKFRKK